MAGFAPTDSAEDPKFWGIQFLGNSRINHSPAEKLLFFANQRGPLYMFFSSAVKALALLNLVFVISSCRERTVASLTKADASPTHPLASYDLILQGGHVFDPAHGIDGVYDVAITGKVISLVAADIPAATAKKVANVKGLFVVPGLIDLHVHVFHGTEKDLGLKNGFSSVAPDTFSFRSGVTTMVDAGSSGWRDFAKFREQTQTPSNTRIFAFLNIFGSGMIGESKEQDLNDMSVEKTSAMALANQDIIVGIKLAHFTGEWDGATRAVEAAKIAHLPVMVDFGHHDPALSLDKLFTEVLRPGDIFTHMYGSTPGRNTLVDSAGNLNSYATKARERGILFDVGHGGASFVFDQAVPAVKQGFSPDTISTDLHTGSMNSGMKDILNLMSKFMSMGLTFKQAVQMTTVNAAKSIHHPELGQIGKGDVADIAVLGVSGEPARFLDSGGMSYPGTSRIRCEMTIRNGTPVWDLNGRAGQAWADRNQH